MNNNKQVLNLLEEIGVVQKGHFKLTSGLHSGYYVQCAKLFEYPKTAGQVLRGLLEKLPEGIDTIAAPAIGAITVGYELARLLGCRFVFAERENGKMVLRRGFKLLPQERVLAVEDVVTTGGSVAEVVNLSRELGAEILGVAAVVDRSGGKAEFGAPFFPLATMEIEVYDPESCPFCAQGLPLNKPGSRAT